MTRSPLIVIPACTDGARLPDKPLLEVRGKPMVFCVLERCLKADVGPVIVATDDDRVYKMVEKEGEAVVKVHGGHPVAETINKAVIGPNRVVISVPVNMPFVAPVVVQQLAREMYEGEWDMATPVQFMRGAEGWDDPGVVKVVMRNDNTAMYFSRSQVPNQDFIDYGESKGPVWWKHIGIYAYRNHVLQRLAAEEPFQCELMERLEQLRALQLGIKIKCVGAMEDCGVEVNTPDDLERANKLVLAGV